MPRGEKKRDWVKMWVEGCLHGSINFQLTLEEQAIWFKLIMLSAICGKEPGVISDNDGRPLPHDFIAHELHCSIDSLEITLKKCTNEGRISENHSGLCVVNFKQYQFTEYDRQKPYRQAKVDSILEEEVKYSFEDYIEKVLKVEFSDIGVDDELKQFKLYWAEGKRILKRPKTAFRNWLLNARSYKEQEAKNGSHQGNNKKARQSAGNNQQDRGKYTSGKYGHLVTK